MRKVCSPRCCKLARVMGSIQILLGGLVILVSITSLFRFLHCRDSYSGFDTKALSDRVEEVLMKLATLQDQLEFTVQKIDKDRGGSIDKSEYKKFLEDEVIQPLYSAHISLRQIRLPKVQETRNASTPSVEDPLINSFVVEEIRKYITAKTNRVGKVNIYGTEKIYNTIGHACVLMKEELEEYMNYDIGSYCKDDWPLAQKLMINGCDPLPRRRCLTRASKLYLKPHSINESLWKLPDGRNCLAAKNPKRGYTKCSGCFEMEKKKLSGWVIVVHQMRQLFVLVMFFEVKPGEIRIGLDFGIGTGTFAARMREQNVTIISTALNLGAPFNEMIALRGLLPLYVTLNQRLPFFDNTMDLIHTIGFLDGWIDLQLMDFILFDWDRILRPGGLLWVDRFFCKKTELDDFMYMFLQFRYKKHKWVISPKSKDEVYLSALLEKPPRSL
ncbi:hypothetical protein MKW92_024548 [Papaver armeniacum]|nr:hypothetical protein MKW92_024548 [Papaver armeniacum]